MLNFLYFKNSGAWHFEKTFGGRKQPGLPYAFKSVFVWVDSAYSVLYMFVPAHMYFMCTLQVRNTFWMWWLSHFHLKL